MPEQHPRVPAGLRCLPPPGGESGRGRAAPGGGCPAPSPRVEEEEEEGVWVGGGFRCPPGAAGGGPALPLCPGRRGRLTRWWRRPPLPWLRARGGRKTARGRARWPLSPSPMWSRWRLSVAWLGWPTDREGGTFHGDSFPPAPGTAGKGLAPPY